MHFESPALRVAEERALHEQKLAKMEAEMKMVFQQKVQEKEAKLKQSEEELYARHREMKDALEKQRLELEDKRRRLESGRPLTPTTEKSSVSPVHFPFHLRKVRLTTMCTNRRRRTDSYERSAYGSLVSFPGMSGKVISMVTSRRHAISPPFSSLPGRSSPHFLSLIP